MNSTTTGSSNSKIGLLLSGGGARGAYQVGVLKAIATFYPRNHSIPFPILCGTSAGAINSTALGCYASSFHLGVKKLDWMWRNIRTKRIYHCDLQQVYQHMFTNMTQWMRSDAHQNTATSLLDNAPLRKLINRFVPFERLEANISNGHLHALAIIASSYESGNSVAFYQGHPDIKDWHRSKRESFRDMLHTEHLMASAALPLMFPAIEIQQSFYGDGSIHQLSPLSPAIHLGADKVLCIGLDSPHDQASNKLTLPPNASSVAGHLLDSIFSDTLDSDIERAQRVNSTLALIPPALQKLNNLRPVETLLINPSIDINCLAKRHFDSAPWAIKRLLASIGINKSSDSSLISYLLFEKSYCSELIRAGFNDGIAQKQQLKQFLAISNTHIRSKHAEYDKTH